MADKKTASSKSSAKKTPPKKRQSTSSNSKKTRKPKSKHTKENLTKFARLRKIVLLGLWRLCWKGSLALMAVLAFYVLYLDAKVTKQFEGNKWQLPVQVYARTLDFYPEQYLSEKEVLWELKRLNYSQVNKINRTGQYVVEGRTIRIYRRAFEFYDGVEQGKLFTLNFAGKKLASIVSESGRRVSKARLEPVQIARIGNDSKQDREFVPLDKFPTILKDALLIVEDRQFYEHHGVSVMSILRALYTNIKAGRTVQGGSTLTQQLAKNFYLTRERTLTRKLNEALIALILDFRYSKDAILEAYLNEVYLGQAYNQGVHGLGLAAEFYFAKPVDELEFDQVALLVAMIKGPSYYNPRRYPERARERRDLVLRLLVENGYLSTDEFRQSLERSIKVEPLSRNRQQSYPGYLELVNRELKSRLPDQQVINAGVRIFTYFDLQKQAAMEESIRKGLPYLERKYKTTQLETAMLSVNLAKGGVSALVAGRNMRFSGFNRVLDTKRQVGSLVKPAIYLSAFEQNTHHLGSLLDDGPLSVTDSAGDVWTPENFDRQFRGKLPLYQAFSKSINIPAVNLGLDIGVHKVSNTLNELGIKQKIEQYPSLLLGALELSSFEVAQMYSTLANRGQYQPLTSIASMTNSVGRVLYKHSPRAEQRFSEESIYMTNYGLKRVTKDGTAKRINLHYPSVQLAGKTGTSNDLRDSWFAGFDHNTVTVTWLGRDDNKPTGLTGSSGALELYIRYLKPLNPQAIADQRPDGVRWAFINPKTGLQAAPSCAKVIQLPIRKAQFVPEPICS